MKAARPNFTKFLCMLLVAMAHCNLHLPLTALWYTSCTSGFTDDVMFYTVGQWARINERTTSCLEELGTSWTSDNYSVWSSLLECSTRGKVCCLRLPCFIFKIKSSNWQTPTAGWCLSICNSACYPSQLPRRWLFDYVSSLPLLHNNFRRQWSPAVENARPALITVGRKTVVSVKHWQTDAE